MSEDTKLQNKIDMLERQLLRERNGRKQAEEVLRQKSLELHESEKRLARNTQRLNQALYASGESVWEWQAKEDIVRVYLSIDKSEVVVKTLGSFSTGLDLLEARSRRKFVQNWEAHKAGEISKIDMHVQYYNEDNDSLRWARVCGQFVTRDNCGVGTHFTGILKDITRKYEKQLTLDTIAMSFLLSAELMFILKLDSLHLEVTAAASASLGVPNDLSLKEKQDRLTQSLPVSNIKRHQTNKVYAFEDTITLASGEQKKAKFRLFPGYTPNTKDSAYEYAVGAFKF
ncbi:hypothetical protein [Agaribacter flavus]|uniref:Uncharacterized protein n=1 Tax=Agaribacter flavus TaxID=1902781 RepID=A0ABV7FTS0_9ALTE